MMGWAWITGVDTLTNDLAQYTARLVLRARANDATAAQEIVARAKAAVPQDTGLLFSGIFARMNEDGNWTVEAGATHGRGRWYDLNYAFLVEYGTQPGERGGRRGGTAIVKVGGRSRAGAFNPVTGRRFRVANASRKSSRTHPGTAPQPFFYPAVDAVLGDREARQAALVDQDL